MRSKFNLGNAGGKAACEVAAANIGYTQYSAGGLYAAAAGRGNILALDKHTQLDVHACAGFLTRFFDVFTRDRAVTRGQLLDVNGFA